MSSLPLKASTEGEFTTASGRECKAKRGKRRRQREARGGKERQEEEAKRGKRRRQREARGG